MFQTCGGSNNGNVAGESLVKTAPGRLSIRMPDDFDKKGVEIMHLPHECHLCWTAGLRMPRTSPVTLKSARKGHKSVSSVSCGSLNHDDTGTAL
jgi:hypothetical protein